MNLFRKNSGQEKHINGSLADRISPDQLLESITDAVFITDTRLNIYYVNKAAGEMTGCNRADLPGEKICRFICSPEIEKSLTAAINSRKETFFTNETVSGKSGIRIECDIIVTPVVQDDAIEAVILTFRDTGKERKIRELRRSCEIISEQTEKPIIQVNENGKPILFNQALLKMTGRSSHLISNDLWLRKYFAEIIFQADGITSLKDITQKYPAAQEIRINKGSQQKLIRIHTEKAGNETGAGYIFIFEEFYNNDNPGTNPIQVISGQNENRLQPVLITSDIGIWALIPSTGKMLLDKRSKELAGFAADSTVNFEDFINCIHTDDRTVFLHGINPSEENKNTADFDIDFRIIRKNDTIERWINSKGKALYNDMAQKLRITGTMSDITEKKHSEKKLAASERRFRNLADTAPVFIWLTGTNLKAEYLNDKWVEYTGIDGTAENNWKTVFHPEDLEAMVSLMHNSFQTRSPFTVESRIKRKSDGSYRWILFTGVLRSVTGELPEGFIITGIDINERKESEKALSDSLSKFSFLAESMPQKLWLTDNNGYIDYINNQWLQYTGVSSEALKEKGWKKIIHPGDLAECRRIWKQALETGAQSEAEARFRNSKGEYRWHITRGNALKDEHGNVIMWVGTSTDIHDKKSAFENLTRAHLQLKKVNTDLDNFIYTASHDLRAPISNLEGLLAALLEEGELTEAQNSIMDMINSSIERFKTTICDLTEITKAQRVIEDDLQTINLKSMLEEVSLDMSALFTAYKPVIRYRLAVKEIKYSRKNIRSILYNILSNALKYSSPERRPEILITTSSLNGYILLTIRDNGLGISPENQNKIFGMFKRAHQHVEGTGIGLYIIKRMIENSGGRIEVESREGEGSAFKIYLRKGNG
jgi:PAS domain S-box-containing protein